jgi:hypothetical protein
VRSQIFRRIFGFILPSSLNPIFGPLTRDLPFQTMNWTFPGIVPLALAVGASVRYRDARTWGWAALVFAILMLGPFLQIAGTITTVPLPYTLFFFIPLLKSNRYPFRLNSIFMLTLTLAASYAFAEILKHAQQHFMEICHGRIVALGFVEQLLSYAIDRPAHPGIFSDVRAGPGDFAVLDLPLGWRNSAHQAMSITAHTADRAPETLDATSRIRN